MINIIRKPDFNADLRLWLPIEEIDAGTMEQLENAATHPEVAHAVAVMPDTHVGYGIPIGCVFPTVNAIIPNAVGVDIGCGMCATNTGIKLDRKRMNRLFWRKWSGQVGRDVLTGFNWHKRAQNLGDLDRPLRASSLQPWIKRRAAVQLGTLGGGNHFLEAQVDENDHIWFMVHSGSRATGLQIANYYNKLAVNNSKTRNLQAVKDLSSLPLDDQIGQDYVTDMNWATGFALASREKMLRALARAFYDMIESWNLSIDAPSDESFINIHHNFASMEEHEGHDVVVHRKGATSAFAGQLGIIPGSMGTNSFIVRGLGNENSLKSCSHGAGRRMGRKAAKRAITAEEFSSSLDGTYSKASMGYVDEAPAAYKDINIVMERQTDLVDVVHILKPIITVKGDSRARED